MTDAKEPNIENIINMNYRALTLLGMVTSIVMDIKHDGRYKEKLEWIIQAINDVVYLGKPLPPMTKR